MRCATDVKDGVTVHAGTRVAPGIFEYEGRVCVHNEADPDGEGAPVHVRIAAPGAARRRAK